jgi:hypothetical protein
MLETLCDAAETGPGSFVKHRPLMLSRYPVHWRRRRGGRGEEFDK